MPNAPKWERLVQGGVLSLLIVEGALWSASDDATIKVSGHSRLQRSCVSMCACLFGRVFMCVFACVGACVPVRACLCVRAVLSVGLRMPTCAHEDRWGACDS